MDPRKARYAKKTTARSLAEVIERRRYLPRAVGARRAEARDGQEDGGQAADLRARQSDARDHAGGGARRPARCGDRHRPVGLSQSGQQRPLLPLHLPRRARCRRHHHQRGDEEGLRRGAGRAGPRRALGYRGAGLWRRDAGLRPGLSDSAALRSAADRRDRAGRRQGGDGERRGDPADRRFRRLSRPAQPVRLPHRPGDEAAVRSRPARSQARGLCRGRG